MWLRYERLLKKKSSKVRLEHLLSSGFGALEVSYFITIIIIIIIRIIIIVSNDCFLHTKYLIE